MEQENVCACTEEIVPAKAICTGVLDNIDRGNISTAGYCKNIRYPRVAPCFPQISRDRGPPLHTCCRCFTVGFSRGYPEENGYEQGLTDIRMRWCKEHKYLDKFGPPERNTIRPVWWFVFPQVLSPILEGSLFALI